MRVGVRKICHCLATAPFHPAVVSLSGSGGLLVSHSLNDDKTTLKVKMYAQHMAIGHAWAFGESLSEVKIQ